MAKYLKVFFLAKHSVNHIIPCGEPIFSYHRSDVIYLCIIDTEFITGFRRERCGHFMRPSLEPGTEVDTSFNAGLFLDFIFRGPTH
jgi:hypothetical protein